MEEKNSTYYLRKTGRILLKTVLYIFLFIVLVFILLFTPPVQKLLTGKVQNYLEKKLQTKVAIGRISFSLFGKISLENVYIEDKTKDTLVSGGAIKAHLSFFKLFSNEVQVKDLEFQNITAKIKRVLPDTVYNFQFIVNAFTSEQVKKPDTAKTAPMKLDVSDIALDNVNITFKDAITGNDVYAHVGNLSASIDTLDPYTPKLYVPTLIVRNVTAHIKQTKPLLEPKPLDEHIAQAATPSPAKLFLGSIDLNKVYIDYGNDVSALYTIANIGQLKLNGKQFDLQNNKIYLDQLALNNSKITMRLGKSLGAKVVAKEANKKVVAAKTVGWDVRVAKIQLDNNALQFDNDNNPKQTRGIDFSHLVGDSISLYASNFIMNNDSTGLQVTKGSLKEKSGFRLSALQGDILYAQKETYLKNLYIKTPGSEIKKSLVLDYPSMEALTKDPARVLMNIDLENSRIQVRDILAFAPQLRSNPALANPNDIWHVNIIGNGTLNRLAFESLQFSGLRNTQINAKGTLVGLMNPKQAGGNFVIYRLHTTQSDIALFTGKRLSTPTMELPEEFDMNGTVIGNSGNLNTNLNINTSEGFIGLNGRFSNLTDMNTIGYNATLRTRGLQVGRILKQQGQFGSATASLTFNGHGADPKTMNTNFNGVINSIGFNKYQYKNIKLNGRLKENAFTAKTVIKDPNIDVNLTASGSLNSTGTYTAYGMIDSIKTLPLHFTTQPMVFRGQIDAKASNITADNPDANILITKALVVANNKRLPLDSIQLSSGKTDTASFIRLKSNIANASIIGQYKIADLGNIVQSTIEPYFSVAPQKAAAVQPYDFRFNLDVVNSPLLTAFVPTLTTMDPVHAEGRFSSDNGMQAVLTSNHIVYNGTDISALNISANTSAKGLQVAGVIGHLKSGSSFDVYNTRINATALNNNIDFSLGLGDQNGKNKYHLAGLLTQPSNGTYTLKLKPDSLMLNYQMWTVPADNSITISPTNIIANDFTLQQGAQKISLNSLPSSGVQPLQVSFTSFRLATITGFIKADSVLVDGVMNGNVTFTNLLQHPLFTSDLTINDLSMRKDTLGNVNLKITSDASNRYNTNITLSGRGNDASISGYVQPIGSDINLNLDLAVRQLQLHTLEGAMASAITNASGAIDGAVKIRGTASKPSIQGDLNFDKAAFVLTPLGSKFSIDNQKISVTENGFIFNKFTVKDSANNALVINGNIASSNFVNYNFNLDVTADNFMLLNSTKKQNKLYYGKLNVTSKLHIAGTEIKPVIDGNLAVNKGTDLTIVIPQAEPGVEDRKGIVQFVNMSHPEFDSLFKGVDTINNANVFGMDITTNITISKEANFNIIVDQANGDFLNVRGEAELTAGVDPSGKISLTGNYTLEEGSYQLAFNFIQRKFTIEKGSNIVWAGDPTSAQLNVTAVYIANTAPLDLVQQQLAESPAAIRNTYLQKLPFEVHLTLTGELMQPEVAFDILLPEDKNYGVSNDIVTDVQARLSQLREDHGEMNKQVFSLLLLGRFVGDNPFQSSGGSGLDVGTYARQSVSKLLTEQLNQLAAGLINGVDINFDVVSTDDYTTGDRRNRTDLNIGLSKRLLNDRLKVTVGSNFELEGPQNSNQQSNNIADNISADYQISRDGRYMLRFYRRNQYEGVVDGYIIETGLGFIMSVDYNKFSQILHRRKQKVTRPPANTQNQSSQ
ncbi:MAG: translocation/assembly module TamB domain-containing protein [Flavisolibacter sp.]